MCILLCSKQNKIKKKSLSTPPIVVMVFTIVAIPVPSGHDRNNNNIMSTVIVITIIASYATVRRTRYYFRTGFTLKMFYSCITRCSLRPVAFPPSLRVCVCPSLLFLA